MIEIGNLDINKFMVYFELYFIRTKMGYLDANLQSYWMDIFYETKKCYCW